MLARATPGDDRFYKRWEEIGPVISHVSWDSYAGHFYCPTIHEAGVLVCDQRGVVDSRLLKYLPNVKYVVSATTGHTHLQFDPKEHGITLVTLQGEKEFLGEIRSVSEFAFRLMLSLARPLNGYGHTLAGKTLGIVGFGRIGKHMILIASSFGMKCQTFDVQNPYSKLERIFRSCDFISIHLSETPESQGLIDRELIGMLLPHAYLINTARPSVIDEPALALALREGRMAGAALDVVGEASLFHGLTNVIVTPHIAGSTIEDRIKTDEFMVRKLKGIMDSTQGPGSRP